MSHDDPRDAFIVVFQRIASLERLVYQLSQLVPHRMHDGTATWENVHAYVDDADCPGCEAKRLAVTAAQRRTETTK